jgi:hypothetical protein
MRRREFRCPPSLDIFLKCSAVVLAVNKWDAVCGRLPARKVQRLIETRLAF